MRAFLLAGLFVLLTADPGLACRGTAEYPVVAAQLSQAHLAPVERQSLELKLMEGQDLHSRGHELDDASLRRQSLKILDEIKAAIGH